MKQAFTPIVFGMALLITGCSEESPSSVNGRRAFIRAGTYHSPGGEWESEWECVGEDSIYCRDFTGEVSSLCTTATYGGTYQIAGGEIHIHCRNYAYRDTCAGPWIPRSDISGLSFPIRGVGGDGFEIRIGNYWYKYELVEQ
jgi:hypothetical protein